MYETYIRPVEIKQDATAISGTYAYYLSDDWTIGANLAVTESSIDDSYEIGLSSKRLWKLGKSNWLGIDITLTSLHPEERASNYWRSTASASYYINSRTSLSLTYDKQIRIESESYSFGLKHYINEVAYISLSTFRLNWDSTENQEIPPDHATGYSMGFGLRF